MSKPSGWNQRWYDGYDNIKVVVDDTRCLPEVQIAYTEKQLCSYIAQYADILNRAGIPKSLGVEVTLSLYRSKARKRWYDQRLEFHQSMNTIHAFPVPALENLNAKLHGLASEVLVLAKSVRLQAEKTDPELTKSLAESPLQSRESIIFGEEDAAITDRMENHDRVRQG